MDMHTQDSNTYKRQASNYFKGIDLTQTEQLEAVFDRFLDDLEAGSFSHKDIAQVGQTWDGIACTLVQYSLSLPFDTCEGSKEAFYYGWPTLLECLEACGEDLPLPVTAASPLEIFSPELLHHIHLQTCLEWLSGIGQGAETSLSLPEQQGRIEALIEALQEHNASVRYLELNLHDLLAYLIMPEPEKKRFAKLLSRQLNLPSEQVLLVDYLGVST